MAIASLAWPAASATPTAVPSSDRLASALARSGDGSPNRSSALSCQRMPSRIEPDMTQYGKSAAASLAAARARAAAGIRVGLLAGAR